MALTMDQSYSVSPAPVGQSAAIWRVVTGKTGRARLGPSQLNLARTRARSFRRTRQDKWKATKVNKTFSVKTVRLVIKMHANTLTHKIWYI